MLGSIRRVDPSRLVQSRYEHPDANKREQPPDDFQEPGAEPEDEEPDRAEERRASSKQLPEAKPAQPQLLANRPVLRWLRTGEDDPGASSRSAADRFPTDAEHEQAQREIVEHLATTRQYSLQSMLERASLLPSDAPSSRESADGASDDRSRDEYEKRYDTPEPPSSVDLEG